MYTPDFIAGQNAAFRAVERCYDDYRSHVSPEHLSSPEGLEALNVFMDCLIAIAALIKTPPVEQLHGQVDALLEKVEAMRG